jgi:hypothetical protein
MASVRSFAQMQRVLGCIRMSVALALQRRLRTAQSE